MKKLIAVTVILVLAVCGGISFGQLHSKWICDKCGMTAMSPYAGACGMNGGQHHWVRND